MKITKSQLKKIIKEELSEVTRDEVDQVIQGAEPEMAEFYANYSDDPIEALELRRIEIKNNLLSGRSSDPRDFEEYKNLGREIRRLKATQ